MPNSKSAPYLAFALLGATGLWLALACSGLLVTPGGSAGTAGTTGTAGTGSGNAAAAPASPAPEASRRAGGSGGTARRAAAASPAAARRAPARGQRRRGDDRRGGDRRRRRRGGATGTAGGGAGGGARRRAARPGHDAAARSDARGERRELPLPAEPRDLAAACYPTGYLNADVMAAYAQWKTDTVTSNGAGRVPARAADVVDRVQHVAPRRDSTVSEGIGYGMIIAVFMGDTDAVRRPVEVRAGCTGTSTAS